MLLHWRRLFAVLLLYNAVLLEMFRASTSSSTIKSTTDKYEAYSTSSSRNIKENSFQARDKRNATVQNITSSSTEEEKSVETEALYGQDNYDNHHDSGMKRWKDPVIFNITDNYDQQNSFTPSWPQKNNRWGNPQEDAWNFALRTSDQCNKVDLKGIPDHPVGYSDQAVPFPVDYGNVSVYNVYTERCCQGKTYPKYSNGKYSCCDSSDYDTLREVCCNGKVYPQQTGYECCGEILINTNEEICCYHPEKGVLAKQLPLSAQQSKETRLFSQCCGEETFDTRSHVCFLVTNSYNEFANFTVVEKKYNHTGCCEGKPYDQDNDVCNETGLTYTFLSGPPCVFKKAYDRMQNSLRFREAQNYNTDSWNNFGDNVPSSYLLQCRGKMYDPSYQLCCGDVNHLEENGSVKIWDKKDSRSACCGTEMFKYKTHHCCNNTIIPIPKGLTLIEELACCGKELYDPRTQWCCKGTTFVVIKSTQKIEEHCCGPQALVFNVSRHVCCNNHLSEIPQGANFSYWHGAWNCCTTDDHNTPEQVYNVDRAKCCNGIVHDVEYPWNYDCCGTKLYNNGQSKCCAGKILNDSSCCGGKEAYDPSTHNCCDFSVAAKPTANADSCCGKTPYDRQLQTCCMDQETSQWKLTRKKYRNERCCGGKVFDANSQECCGSSIVISDRTKNICCRHHDKKTGKYSYAAVERKAKALNSCCGLSVFNLNNEICCDGNVFSNVHRNTSCCKSTAYDLERQICCLGNVHSRSTDNNVKCCGENLYDVRKEICCGGVVLSVTDVNSAMCCYEKLPFNTAN